MLLPTPMGSFGYTDGNFSVASSTGNTLEMNVMEYVKPGE